ncbi:MAG: SDR family oxidoreductase [Cyanobacteria bacterium P01_F01_bin.42]
MKVLILGLGFTGTRLGRWLVERDYQVVGTCRSGAAPPGLPIPIVKFNSQDNVKYGSSFWEPFFDVTHVVSTIAPGKDGTDPAWMLLDQHPHPQALTWTGYLSTTGVYGDTGGAWVDELSPTNPGSMRSRNRVQIENCWLSSGYPVHIFRLPGIYGPSRSVFERLRSGKARQIVKPGHVFSRVHVDDIVQTVGQSMLNPCSGAIYNVVDDEPSEPRELLIEAAALIGIEPPPPTPFAQVQLSPMARSFWAECRRVSNQKIKSKLGIRLLYPSYREGLRAILNT